MIKSAANATNGIINTTATMAEEIKNKMLVAVAM